MRISTILICLALAHGALAQSVTHLDIGESVLRDLSPSERHSFVITIPDTAFVEGHANQISTDIVIVIFSPNGDELGRFDGPARGDEAFAFDAKEAGEYRIDVLLFSQDEPGSYELVVDAVVAIRPLLSGVQIQESLSGSRHVYSVDLETGQRVVGQASQHDIDVRVEVRGPQGATNNEFDNSESGSEKFGFKADSTGSFQIHVVSAEEGSRGQYTLKIQVVEANTEFDDGSSLPMLAPSLVQIENLALLGRVWGFLKYHHPTVTSGQLIWDYELFRIVPEVVGARDRSEALEAITRWAMQLDAPLECAPCATTEGDTHLEAPTGWIEDTYLLGPDLSHLLTSVRRNRHARGAQYYVRHPGDSGVGNPKFLNEPDYAEFETPDAGFRLLALFRFWNIIEYWFPYRDLIDGTWSEVLSEFVPRLLNATDADSYALEMMALIARVTDTHANLWSSIAVRPPRGPCRIPVVTRFVEGQAVVTHLVRENKLVVGDVITSLDGSSVDSLVETWAPYYAASNGPTRLRDIGRFMTRGECGQALLTIRRGGREMEVQVERVILDQDESRMMGRFHDRPGEAFQVLSEEISYLKLSSVERAKAPEYIRRASGSRGLVIDIRNYPSEFVVFALGNLLIDRPTEFARFTSSSTSNPGTFNFGNPLSLQPQEPHFDGQVIILVDEMSQSQAEYTTMAFRSSPNALVIGSTTAGADGNVSRIPLPGGLRSLISGIGVFYPDKRPTQRIGIVPDLVVKPTIEGIRDGRDEVLEAAIRVILGDEVDQAEIERMSRHRENG